MLPQTRLSKCKIQLSFFERQLLLHVNISKENVKCLVYKKWLVTERARFLHDFN